MSFFTYHITYSSFGDIGAKSNIVLRPAEVDKSTTLQLPGQGKTNYGEFYNQNLLYLMEHFAKATPPERPTSGQIWYQPYLAVPTLNPPNIPNPTCGQIYYPPGSPDTGCQYINQYVDLSYIDADYLETLTCVPYNLPLTTDHSLMYDCDVQQWVERKYVSKLRVYTGIELDQDPDYPGWKEILTKQVSPPAVPNCGDTFFNITAYTDNNVDIVDNNGTVTHDFAANTLYYWDCSTTPHGWNIVGNRNFVRLDGSNTPMVGPLRLISNAAIDASTNGDTAVSKDWAVRKAGDTMTGYLTLHANPTVDYHAATKYYVDNSHDWVLTLSAKGTPWDNITIPVISGATYLVRNGQNVIIKDDHSVSTNPNVQTLTNMSGRKYWDTLYRNPNNGALEVNNIYWRNFTDDIKDRLMCAFDQFIEFAYGPINIPTGMPLKGTPSNENGYFKSWVADRDIELFLYYGPQPQQINLTVDLIQTANYSTISGAGGLLGVTQRINLNHALNTYLRTQLGNSTFTVHEEDFGTTNEPGKYSILQETLPTPTIDTKVRSELPQINTITGFTIPWAFIGYPNYPYHYTEAYPTTPYQISAHDCQWVLNNLGATYTGPAGFGGRNDTRLYIDLANTTKTRDDTNQRWILNITVVDGIGGNTYVIRHSRHYNVGTGGINPNNFATDVVYGETYVSGGTPPGYVRFMARIYAVWQYTSTDIRHLLHALGQSSVSYPWDQYVQYNLAPYNTVHTNVCMCLGLWRLVSGTSPGHPQYDDYLAAHASYTVGLAVQVSTTNFNRATGDLDLRVSITSGSIGYSLFPSSTLVNKATVPLTYKIFPAIGWNPNTGEFESIVNPNVFTNACDW